MKKLGFLLLAFTANAALAAPQANVTAAVAVAGADASWTADAAEKNAHTTQLKELNSVTANLSNIINADLDEKIAKRLREQAEAK
ncbi:hypothetical protein L1F30_16640 [Simiduia sp. 21SJ11W-1]|uniref:hypothetical protein n=1 Tax=Simiduia sp. 21SJ11W-1 TaxID=2909669 RepID=UPI00209F1CEB|nr:hypothetical protein [Simiduia sp. 21SJ11W-1]UTA47769.1 hypothetical protein L1F30_16640 [Simiduia sp. 21SJ11W-1]